LLPDGKPRASGRPGLSNRHCLVGLQQDHEQDNEENQTEQTDPDVQRPSLRSGSGYPPPQGRETSEAAGPDGGFFRAKSLRAAHRFVSVRRGVASAGGSSDPPAGPVDRITKTSPAEAGLVIAPSEGALEAAAAYWRAVLTE
jgi:hypothetical protein